VLQRAQHLKGVVYEQKKIRFQKKPPKPILEENLDGLGMSGKKPFGTGSNVTTRGSHAQDGPQSADQGQINTARP